MTEMEEELRPCTVCGQPVLWGTRHSHCGALVLAAAPALAVWREVCEDAPAAIMEGRKYLMLSEAACVKLGTALEGAAGVLGTSNDQGENRG